MHHPNVIEMKQHFLTNGDKPDEVYLNVVMDYIPDTVYKVMKQYQKMR
jgi:glycogen synthase kinase 3 beta